MQRKNMFLKQFIVISIVFLLILADFLPIASSIAFAASEDEGIDFTAYFTTASENMENENSIVCDVSESTLKANFEVKVNGKGYLKSGSLILPDNLNFSIKETDEIELQDNKIMLKQIDQNESELISIPIGFERLDKMKSNYMKNKNTIIFSGVYVDNDGVEQNIEKTASLEIAWKDKTSSKIDFQILKNLDYRLDDGTYAKILQTQVVILANEQNSLPIKNQEIKIDVPVIAGMEFKNVTVTSNKLAYSQGREDYNIEFSDENYKVEDNKLIINVGNNEKDGQIFNSCGEDVYIITYQYAGERENDDLIYGDVELTVNNFADEQEVQSIRLEYNLSDAIGNLVQYSRDDKESEISKGYLMANSDADKYEIAYTKRDVLSISRADLVEGLLITDGDEYFVENGDAHVYRTDEDGAVMSSYKSTEFSRENLVNVLGEDGKVEILNINDEVIATVTFDLETDENGIYRVEYNEPISKIKIRISSPVSDGNISILSTKVIKKLNYSRNLIKDFYKLVSYSEASATFAEGVVDSLGSVESVIFVNQTSSNAVLEVDRTELSTTVTNEGVNFKIRLNNNDDISDLYENPVFEVRLPKAVTEVLVRNVDLFYSNDELELSNVETLEDNGQKVIRISLSGMQTSYNLNKETNGTVISFDLDLSLEQLTANGDDEIAMYYYNASSVKYDNEIDWSMLLGLDGVTYFKNGMSTIMISYKAPEGLVNAQTTETKEETDDGALEETNENKVTSAKQGAMSELIEEGGPAKLATMSIAVMNNTNKSYYDFKILGRIPFIGNKDITTGEDLGTTVDTILSSGISSNNQDLVYTVYYSENGDATADLDDETNGWSSDYYKTGGIKSYLIVLDSGYVLKPNTSLEFVYDYVIPAGLTSGDAFFGTYATYYKEESGNTGNSSADKIGYETKKMTDIEASVTLLDDKLKELSDAEYMIEIKNNTNVDAENLQVTFDVPQEFLVQNIEGNDVSGTEENRTITINVPEVKANSTEQVIAKFNIRNFEGEENNVKISASISGANLNDSVVAETEEIPVEKTRVTIKDEYYDYLKVAGNDYENKFVITNVSDEEYHNVKISKQFGEAFEFAGSEISSEVAARDETKDNVDNQRGEKSELNIIENYDSATKTVTWEIESFKPGDMLEVIYKTHINIMPEAEAINIDTISTQCDLRDGRTVINMYEKITYNQSKIEINTVNNHDTGFGNLGEEVTYEWEITNNNNYDVTDFEITPKISDNAQITGIRLETPRFEQDYYVFYKNLIFAVLPANSTSKFIVKAKINEDASGFVQASVDASYDDVYTLEKKVYTLTENSDENVHELTGSCYIDKNRNQIQDDDEKPLQGIVVNLYNSETNELVDSKVTDISGRYTFTNLADGTYYAKFNYDDEEYLISSKRSEKLLSDKSKVININNNYITDNLVINGKGVSNVDIPLVDDEIFDMKVEATVEKMIVQNSSESNEFIPENKQLAKVDILPELLEESKVLVEYKIKVINQGTIPGKVEKLVDYIPKDMELDVSLNNDWYAESDGNVYTNVLENDVINPGESREIKLVLTKNMNEENTGLVHNSVEIANATNDRAVADIDSKPNNRLDEDDLASIDCIIGVTTGLSVAVIPIIVVVAIITIPTAILVWRMIEKRRYV